MVFQLYSAFEKNKTIPNGYSWACQRSCMHTRSLRTEYFFNSFKIVVKTIFKAFYKYLSRLSFVDIAYKFNTWRQTASGIVDLVKKCVCEYMAV